MCVCVFSLGFSDCTVLLVLFVLTWIFSRVLVVSGSAHRREEGAWKPRRVQFCKFSFEWVLFAVVVIFARVSEISDTLCF